MLRHAVLRYSMCYLMQLLTMLFAVCTAEMASVAYLRLRKPWQFTCAAWSNNINLHLCKQTISHFSMCPASLNIQLQ